MTEFEQGTPEYYRNILSKPVIGKSNNLQLDFSFTYANGGTFTMTDTAKEIVYNGTFVLAYDDGVCRLGINAIDFYVEQSNGTLGKWNDTFENQIIFFTEGLNGFPHSSIKQ